MSRAASWTLCRYVCWCGRGIIGLTVRDWNGIDSCMLFNMMLIILTDRSFQLYGCTICAKHTHTHTHSSVSRVVIACISSRFRTTSTHALNVCYMNGFDCIILVEHLFQLSCHGSETPAPGWTNQFSGAYPRIVCSERCCCQWTHQFRTGPVWIYFVHHVSWETGARQIVSQAYYSSLLASEVLVIHLFSGDFVVAVVTLLVTAEISQLMCGTYVVNHMLTYVGHSLYIQRTRNFPQVSTRSSTSLTTGFTGRIRKSARHLLEKTTSY